MRLTEEVGIHTSRVEVGGPGERGGAEPEGVLEDQSMGDI